MERKEGLKTKECLLARIEELEKRLRELEHENEDLKKRLEVFNDDREHMRQMQAKGIAEAKQNGIRFGRPPLEVPEKFTEVFELHRKGEISARAAADMLGVSSNTFRKWIKKAEEENSQKSRKTTRKKCDH